MSYTYKLLKYTSLIECEPHAVLRKEDNAYIPFCEGNIDYQEYLKWKAIDGNEPEAAD
tara:strand:+ start:447 stop:620 length:174 start_codon:yes stop_codon:yes gene_type:complete